MGLSRDPEIMHYDECFGSPSRINVCIVALNPPFFPTFGLYAFCVAFLKNLSSFAIALVVCIHPPAFNPLINPTIHLLAFPITGVPDSLDLRFWRSDNNSLRWVYDNRRRINVSRIHVRGNAILIAVSRTDITVRRIPTVLRGCGRG